jgi:hypothetical protein
MRSHHFPSVRRGAHVPLLGALLILGGACTTAGSTFRSGVGDKLLERPPYYAGADVAGDTTSVGHLPVAYQRGATQEAMFEPGGGSGSPIAALLREMNAYLDSLGATRAIAPAGPWRGTPPDVQFSCETDPVGDCAMDKEGALGRDDIVMRLAVGRPSAEWTAWAAAAMDSARVSRLLLVTLEVGQYRLRQQGLRGDKVVELGTGHTQSLAWLTSLETPVSVLQLTGALVGRDGRAVRIGAEGLFARRTSLPVSAIGGQALLADEDVQQVRTLRREDMPGQPLAWQVALRNLVAQLTGRPPVAVR